jgi:hypothetical protein
MLAQETIIAHLAPEEKGRLQRVRNIGIAVSLIPAEDFEVHAVEWRK